MSDGTTTTNGAGMSDDTKKLIGGAVFTIVALSLTFLITDYRLFQLAVAGSWALAMLGLNLLTGFNGQISLGHGAFMAIGGYTVAICVRDYGMSYPVAFLLGFVICFVVGGLIGIPALRLPGISLALITLAMALAFPQILKKFSDLTGGVQGIATPSRQQFNAPEWTGLTTEQFRYVTVVAIGALSFWLVFNITRSRWGLALMSVRDNPISAASMGVNLSMTKVMAFAISAGLAGLGGAVQAMLIGFISPESITLLVSIQLLTGIVIGGLATTTGALIGGLFVVFMPNLATRISDSAPGVIYGVIIILVMILAPGGVLGLVRQAMARLRAGSSSSSTDGSDHSDADHRVETEPTRSSATVAVAEH